MSDNVKRLGRRFRVLVIVGFLTVCAVLLVLPSCHHYPDQSVFFDVNKRPRDTIVQLRCAKLPYVAAIAAHCYYVVYDVNDRQWDRWEVWQNKDTRPDCWGHVHLNMRLAGSGVGAGDSWALHEWGGNDAEVLRGILIRPEDYPYKDEYHYWPGPNCNTYVAWVLKEAGIRAKLPRAAIGKGY